jgi:hypothetical protein
MNPFLFYIWLAILSISVACVWHQGQHRVIPPDPLTYRVAVLERQVEYWFPPMEYIPVCDGCHIDRDACRNKNRNEERKL